ncbi:Site-specific DNA-methyltransferase (adenine-specific) [Rhizobium etli CNPAF512]|nr:Site-specific DNA-methyltransferase (adenine-specific) [Rhizobium etli CNPAF512]
MNKPEPKPEKMSLASMEIAAEKRQELRQALQKVIPEIFVDGGVDVDQLKRALGDWIEPQKERFGLNWPGKAECMRIIQQGSYATLNPSRADSVDFDLTENVFIEGDNLEVLKLLQKAYFGKIKLIYVDPPYNTGNEFIYPDKFSETLDTYLAYTGQIDDSGKKFSTNADTSGRYHSRWLNMMYPRLYLAKNLLREDGALFISIDDHEVMNLRSICDQIFGEENHIATISVLNNLKGRNDKKNVATCHEYLVVYGNERFESYGIPLTYEQLSEYKYKDQQGNAYALRDLRKRGGADKRTDRPKLYFPIYYNEATGRCALERKLASDIEILPQLGDGTDGCWRWGREKVGKELDILHPKYNKSKDKWGVEHRVYLDPTIRADDDTEADDEDINFERTSKSKSFWWGADISTDHAVRVFKDLFEGMGTDYPKSPKFMKRIIQMATKSDDLILDFFAGFSTTAHATMELNYEEGTNRRFVMVQLPELAEPSSEAAKAGYKTISALSRDRIRRVRESILKRNEGELDLAARKTPDLGFRSFSLARSNFRTWEGDSTGADIEKQLEMHVDHLSKGHGSEDVLYELLLKSGFALTTKVQTISLAGKDVFSIEDGALLICLEKEITPELIDALAEANPLQVICLDEGFKGNDQLKANAVQTFKARAQAEESEIVFKTV